jgi:hypothetical protein
MGQDYEQKHVENVQRIGAAEGAQNIGADRARALAESNKAGAVRDQMGAAYSAYDPQAEAQRVAQNQAANTAEMARGAGANAGKAAKIGGYGSGNVYNNALTSANQQKSNLAGQAYGSAAGQQSNALAAGNQNIQATGMMGNLYNDTRGARRADENQTVNTVGSAIGTGGQILQSVLSDKTTKENVKPARALDATMEKLRSLNFDYKDKFGGEKGNVGVMAQDLEKTPLKNVVKETADGKKMIDTAQLETGNIALIKELYDDVHNIKKRMHFGQGD